MTIHDLLFVILVSSLCAVSLLKLLIFQITGGLFQLTNWGFMVDSQTFFIIQMTTRIKITWLCATIALLNYWNYSHYSPSVLDMVVTQHTETTQRRVVILHGESTMGSPSEPLTASGYHFHKLFSQPT